MRATKDIDTTTWDDVTDRDAVIAELRLACEELGDALVMDCDAPGRKTAKTAALRRALAAIAFSERTS